MIGGAKHTQSSITAFIHKSPRQSRISSPRLSPPNFAPADPSAYARELTMGRSEGGLGYGTCSD